MKGLAINLGNFNCVSCLFITNSNSSQYETFKTNQGRFEGVLVMPFAKSFLVLPVRAQVRIL